MRKRNIGGKKRDGREMRKEKENASKESGGGRKEGRKAPYVSKNEVKYKVKEINYGSR